MISQRINERVTALVTEVFSVSIIEPVIIVGLYLLFMFVINGALPTSSQIVAHLTSLYERYGYEILFLGAFLETLVVVNLFAPGMVALAFGGVFARTGQLNLVEAILAAVLGAMLGYLIDFLLGYFGFSKIVTKFTGVGLLNKVKAQVAKYGVKTFSLGFFHPNVGSVVSLASGTIEMNFLTFLILSSLSTIFWFSLWGTLVYMLGDVVLTLMDKYLSIIGVGLTSFWLLIFLYNRKKQRLANS